MAFVNNSPVAEPESLRKIIVLCLDANRRIITGVRGLRGLDLILEVGLGLP